MSILLTVIASPRKRARNKESGQPAPNLDDRFRCWACGLRELDPSYCANCQMRKPLKDRAIQHHIKDEYQQ